MRADVVRRGPLPEGVPRVHVPGQRGNEPDQRRPDRVAREHAGGEGAAGLPGEQGPVVPADGHQAGSGRGAVRGGLLQQDHRPLRGGPEAPAAGQGPRPRLADRAHPEDPDQDGVRRPDRPDPRAGAGAREAGS